MKTFKQKLRNRGNGESGNVSTRTHRARTDRNSRATDPAPLQAMINNSPVVRTEAARNASINRSHPVRAEAEWHAMIHNSPHQVAQRKLLAPHLDRPIQRQEGLEEDELLQGKAAPGTLQRQGLDDDEEMLQGRFDPVQRQEEMDEEQLLQGRFAGAKAPIQRQDAQDPAGNSTGMPDSLKAGMERLSGLDLSGVRVHRNSSKPAPLNALAYTQGQDIHVGPGQERHLPHEAWHAVQQMQGRVKPTLQAKGVAINDDAGLEHEADVMGARAMGMGLEPVSQRQISPRTNARDDSLDGRGATARRRPPLPTPTPQDHPIQRTAWEKTAEGWRRRAHRPGVFEKDTDTETTPPPAQIGKEGWYYSSSTNAYYVSYEKYKEAVRPYTEEEISNKEDFNRRYEVPPKAVEPRMMTTSLDAEDKLLTGTGADSIDFAEDITRNYLLWSVPKYTGENIKKETGGTLEEVSGEAAAEAGVRGKQGYMMKQTQEHMEALTAIKMIQGDEDIKPEDIQAQYGSDTGPFDPSKVDPLHNPRDPESQSGFIAILKLIDSYYENPDEKFKIRSDIQKRIKSTTKVESLQSAVTRMLILKKTKKDFNKEFFESGKAEQLAKEFADNNEPFGPRDKEEEVTRAVLKDKSDPDLNLVGGRQAVFDTIWGPKSATVVEKAATRFDAVKSHGLTYHWNPKTTVQANHEFPPYLELVQKLLGPKMSLREYATVKPAYEAVVKALNEIIEAVKAIPQQGEAKVADLPKIRENQIQIIVEANLEVEKGMAFIRKNLPK